MATESQIAANRANAKLGGVKTPKGKAVSRWNALQHGILSKEVLVRGGDTGESPEDFGRAAQRLMQALGPVGAVEEMLADRIIALYWRLRRVQRAEVGAIRKTTGDVWYERFLASARDAQATRENPDPFGCYFALVRTIRGIELIRGMLDDLQQQITLLGQLRYWYIEKIAKVYGWDHEFPKLLSIFNDVLTGKDKEAPMTPEEARKYVTECITDEGKRLDAASNFAFEYERAALGGERMTRGVPDDNTTQKLIRYEAHLDRALYRALHELQRVQATRIDGIVALPLAVDVEVSG